MQQRTTVNVCNFCSVRINHLEKNKTIRQWNIVVGWESVDTKFKSYDANKTDSFSRTKSTSCWVTRFMTLWYKNCDSCVCVHSESHRRREIHQLELQHSRSFIYYLWLSMFVCVSRQQNKDLRFRVIMETTTDAWVNNVEHIYSSVIWGFPFSATY